SNFRGIGTIDPGRAWAIRQEIEGLPGLGDRSPAVTLRPPETSLAPIRGELPPIPTTLLPMGRRSLHPS
ncbi:MAG: hypothetical protein M3462_00370, partial [Chloroflexota bacterium]|nr:hypothetical protein [Chloroflexota bacterium]